MESPIHMRTDANNLVTTAKTTHLPEQKETIHMIAQLRTQACSGDIHDLAHVATEDCLADCLTKRSAKPDNLVRAVQTGVLKNIDKHPPFRDIVQHKAFFISLSLTMEPVSWCVNWIESDNCTEESEFLNKSWSFWDSGIRSLDKASSYGVIFMNWHLHSADASLKQAPVHIAVS